MSRASWNAGWYGWRILALATIGHYFGWAATTLHSFGLFVIPVSTEFQWTRAEISLANTVGSIAMVIVAPFVGHLMDRWGPKSVMVPSAFFLGVLLCALQLSDGSLIYYYVVFALMAILGAGTIGPVYARLIFSWFEIRKGLALGIVLGGAAASNAINPPLLNWLIEHYGWRDAYTFLGLVNILLIVPLTAFFIRDEPAQMGLARDGIRVSTSPGAPAPTTVKNDTGYHFDEAIRQPAFWKLAAVFFILAFGQSAVVHLVPLLRSTDISSETAAFAASAFGVTMFISRLGGGILMDRFHAAKVGATLAIASAVGFLILALFPGSIPLAFLAVIFLGLVYGAEGDFMGFLVVTYFGRLAAGKLHTSIFSIFACGSAAGVYVTGLLFDRFGSYQVPLIIATGTAVAATVLLSSFGTYPVLPPARDRSAKGDGSVGQYETV